MRSGSSGPDPGGVPSLIESQPAGRPDQDGVGYGLIPRPSAGPGIEKAKDGLIALGVHHTFRATGITAYLKNGGALETAAAMANHSSTRTTQLYDRRSDQVSLDEIERVRI